MTSVPAPGRTITVWPALLLGVLAGLLHALTLSWPQQGAWLWVLQPLAVAVLVAALDHVARQPPSRARGGAAAALAWGFGFAWLAGSVWWLFISMHRYGGLPAWMAALAVALLCAFLSLYLALAGWAYQRWRSGHAGRDTLLFVSLWLLAELARGALFTGFPWAASGYAHVDGPLAAWAPWLGVYGIGAIAAALAAGAALLLSRPPSPPRAAPVPGRALRAAALAAVVLGGSMALTIPNRGFTTSTGRLNVTLLQGNVPQDQKFAMEYLPLALAWHVRGIMAAQSDLVVAPETAIPLLPDQLPTGLWPDLKERFATGPTAALFGVPLGSLQDGYTNSAVGLAPGQRAEFRYDKHHLVPFGEFIPTGFRWFTEMMNIPLGDFSRGSLNQPSFTVGAQRVAPNICYEDLFGEELAARFRNPAAAPTLFANITNIGWFGDSIADDQHLNISRLRTLELQRAMLRATNTGMTAVVDHEGKVTYRMAPFTRGVLEGRVEGREGVTPFARWAAWGGLWPLLAAGALGVAAAAGLRRREAAGP